MPGNLLGPRGYYTYESDSGEQYNVLTDTDLATAAGLTPAAAGQSQLPRRFKPRVVFCEATVAGKKVRKNLVIGSITNALYSTEAASTVTIDGQAFTVTGRRGEKVTFGNF